MPPECDVVVLAGDISPGFHGVDWAMRTFTQPVVYVMGNHEFWGMRGYERHVKALRERTKGSNVYILRDETIEIDGVRFIGATLWTNMGLFHVPAFSKGLCHRAMLDYDLEIHLDDGTFLGVDDTLAEHHASVQYIINTLLEPFAGRSVVVTHMAPSAKSIAPEYENHPRSPAYASHLDNLMHDFKPDLWLHGHVHNNFDYMVGPTRVVCNPRGYRSPKSPENNTAFDPGLVIEI